MAGILPYAKQVINNKKHIYFLFSRETLDNKNFNHKGMWSDFGGSKEKGESILETAVREGYEEMSGMLGSKTKLRNLVTKTDIKHVTKSNYHCNFMQISYNKQLPYYLENNYKFIKKTNPSLICSNGYFEKDKFSWIEYNDLKKNVSIFRPFYRDVIYFILKNKDIF